jgi:putative DNA primase/helicase
MDNALADVEFMNDLAADQERRAGENFALKQHMEYNRSIQFPASTSPKPLPSGLPDVQAFDPLLLPNSLRPWVTDIAERMQCPLDFVAIPAMVALGSVIGRKIGLRPQARTDWTIVPNLWGCIIGRPGVMKSPAMEQALAPLKRLEAKARDGNKAAQADYAIQVDAHKLRKESATKAVRATLAKDQSASIGNMLAVAEPDAPKIKRYIANDCTYEALGVIMCDNPDGVLVSRDELVSLLKSLDREEQAPARGFYLSAWNGDGGYTFDRIMRGQSHIEAACVSMIGSTQPGRIADYIRRAVSGGASDDGLIQRFGLLVYPDQVHDWVNVDRYPDGDAKRAAFATFERLDALDPDALGAERDDYTPVPYLRFSPQALEIFAEWRAAYEVKLRAGDLHPALESHLAKYRKTIPALALIIHLANGHSGPVSETATVQALAWGDYLESHARRCYAAGLQSEVNAARAILARLRKGELASVFTSRDIQQKGWSSLSDKGQVQEGLDLLEAHDWLTVKEIATGGRPRVEYTAHPQALAKEARG